MFKSLFSGVLMCAMALGVVGASEARAQAKVGEPAPAFTLQDQDGQPVTLESFKGKTVVLEWFNNECPYVQKFYTGGDMNRLAEEYASRDVVWLAVNSTKSKDNAANKAIAGEWKIARPILNDATGVTGKAYGAKTTPHMYVINPQGTLVYAGAIDDKKSAEAGDVAGAKNYVRVALDEILAGKSVTTASTKAYGCSVKYAK